VPFSDIEFRDCFVPEANRLGPEGAGMSLSTSFLEWERCSILASQIGAMQRQLERAIRYAKERKQFGKSIGKYQSVANRIVDMKLRLETSRLLLYKTAWLKQAGKSAMLEAAMLKLHLGEAFVASSMDAIKVHGGRGYVSEFGIERDLRDAVGGTIYAGTSDIQRNIVADLLGL
jgi:alkylation response protein AidB-like acyl-CoA dehydrogenase